MVPLAVHPSVAWAPTVRLRNGSVSTQGRLEVSYQGSWTPVCGDFYFSPRAAAVVCRQLGLLGGIAVLEPFGRFGNLAGSATALRLQQGESCTAASNHLYDCGSQVSLTTSCSLVAVTCSNATGGCDLAAAVLWKPQSCANADSVATPSERTGSVHPLLHSPF